MAFNVNFAQNHFRYLNNSPSEDNRFFDLERPQTTLTGLLLEYAFQMLAYKHHIDYGCSKILHADF